MGAGFLENRTAIVSGADVGIGRTIANRLSASGARIVINDIDEVLVRETGAAISNVGGVAAIDRINGISLRRARRTQCGTGT